MHTKMVRVVITGAAGTDPGPWGTGTERAWVKCQGKWIGPTVLVFSFAFQKFIDLHDTHMVIERTT